MPFLFLESPHSCFPSQHSLVPRLQFSLSPPLLPQKKDNTFSTCRTPAQISVLLLPLLGTPGTKWRTLWHHSQFWNWKWCHFITQHSREFPHCQTTLFLSQKWYCGISDANFDVSAPTFLPRLPARAGNPLHLIVKKLINTIPFFQLK